MIIKSYLLENGKTQNLFDYKFLLFYGQNLGIKNEFKKKIKSSSNECEIYDYDQGEILSDEEGFFNNFLNESLFVKKKIFIINQCNEKIINLIDKVKDKVKDQKIFFFCDLLDKKSKLRNLFEKSKEYGAIACYEDNDLTLKKIIQNELKGFSGLTTININILIKCCGSDRLKLNNELNKIKSLFIDKKIVTEKLEKLIDQNINDDFLSIKDFALKGKGMETNELLSNSYFDNEKIPYYLSIINQRFFKLKELILLSNKNNFMEAVNKIKPPLFWKDKPYFLEQAKLWNKNKIDLALKKTYDFELTLKTNSSINKNVLIKKLIVDICILANS